MRLYRVHGWRFALQESSSISSASDGDGVSEITATVNPRQLIFETDALHHKSPFVVRHGWDILYLENPAKDYVGGPLRRSLILIFKWAKVIYLSFTGREEIEEAVKLILERAAMLHPQAKSLSSNLRWFDYRTENIYFRAHTGKYAKSGYINKYCWGFSDYKWNCLCYQLRIYSGLNIQPKDQRQALKLWLPRQCLKRQPLSLGAVYVPPVHAPK